MLLQTSWMDYTKLWILLGIVGYQSYFGTIFSVPLTVQLITEVLYSYKRSTIHPRYNFCDWIYDHWHTWKRPSRTVTFGVVLRERSNRRVYDFRWSIGQRTESVRIDGNTTSRKDLVWQYNTNNIERIGDSNSSVFYSAATLFLLFLVMFVYMLRYNPYSREPNSTFGLWKNRGWIRYL